MEKTRDKLRSIGCLLAGIGMLLVGISAAFLVVTLCTLDVGRWAGLPGLGKTAGVAGGPAATNVVSVMLTLATNISEAAQNGGDPLAGLTGGQIEDAQRQLLDQLSDPAKMAAGFDGVLSDTNMQKQILDIVNSDLFKQQMEQLLGGQLAPVSQSAVSSTNQ